MNLIIDIGNTQTKFFLFNKKELAAFHLIPDVNSNIIIAYCAKNEVRHCIISSVQNNPEALQHELQNKNIHCLILNHQTSIPISVNYKTPQTLGMDRLAGVVGAAFLFPEKTSLVIDAGTAITYDIITAKSVYEGGSISPGMMIRYKSLNNYTKKLPLLEASNKIFPIGKNTTEAIHFGVEQGIAFEMEGQVNYFKKIYDDLIVILTGGDALYFEKYLKKPIFVEPNLIGIGLNNILIHNVE